MKTKVWWRWFIIAGSLVAIGYNLAVLTRSVVKDYRTPLARRAALPLMNMGSMIELVDKYLPADRQCAKVGIWYDINDLPTKNHLCMLLTNRLYPTKAVIATTNNLSQLDVITGYSSHFGELSNALADHRFRLVATNGNISLYGHSGLKPSPPASCVTPPSSLRQLAGLLAACLALLPIGWLLAKRLKPILVSGPTGGGLVSAWTLGVLSVALIFPAIVLAGIPFTTLSVALTMAAMVLVLVLRRRVPFVVAPPPSGLPGASALERWVTWCLAVAACAWCGLTLADTLAYPVFDITGIGVWGLKAKAFLACRGLDSALLTDPDCAFCHQAYPIGFPLLLTFCYLWMGGAEEWVIKLVPVFAGFGAGILLYRALRWSSASRLVAATGALLFCSGEVFTRQSTFLEAETIFLLFALPGFVFLMAYLKENVRAHLWLGVLFLIGGACIKQEGAVFLVVGVGLVALFSGLFKFKSAPGRALLDFGGLILVTAVFVLPWWLYVRHHVLPVDDFSVAVPAGRPLAENLAVWRMGLKSFGELMFSMPSSVSWIWWLATVGVVIHLRTIWRRRELLFLLAASWLLVLMFGSVYVCSVYTDRLDWHMQASERLLLLPTALQLIVAVMIYQREGAVEIHRRMDP
ncbi:MAG: phospholipid carrier-dependent glycosyltransferase [bacterium]